MAGKSTFVKRLIENRCSLFTVDFDRIIYCSPPPISPENNQDTEDYIAEIRAFFPNLEIARGLPDTRLIVAANRGHSLVVLDDLSEELYASDDFSKMFQKNSHHERVSSKRFISKKKTAAMTPNFLFQF
jgi:hypothetical protein